MDREKALKEVLRALIEEGGEATLPRLHHRLHNRLGLPVDPPQGQRILLSLIESSSLFEVYVPRGAESHFVRLSPPTGGSREPPAAEEVRPHTRPKVQEV